jgi:hypothetical protein
MHEITKAYLYYLNEEEENLNEFVGITAIALIAIYKKYLSKAARFCRQKPPEERPPCITRYQIDGRKAQLQKLKDVARECNKDKKPNDCKKKILKKAQSINKQVQKLIGKYQKASLKMKGKKIKKAARDVASGKAQI